MKKKDLSFSGCYICPHKFNISCTTNGAIKKAKKKDEKEIIFSLERIARCLSIDYWLYLCSRGPDLPCTSKHLTALP